MTLSQDLGMAALVESARAAVVAADPLAAALLGDELAVPNPDEAAEEAALASMAGLATAAEQLGGQAGADDELDRLALLYGLRRAIASARPQDPSGPLLVERHIQVRLLQILDTTAAGQAALAELIEAAPGLLRGARRDPGRGSATAGRLALDSARRAPALLDACAGAVRDAETAIRVRVEAGLGPLLQASAEESGWLLKEYIPAAPDEPPRIELDTQGCGLGMSVDELEAEAEAALAGAVGEMAEGAPVQPADSDPDAAELDEVERQWLIAARSAGDRWGAPGGPGARLTAAPAWLAPLLPPVSLWHPGPLAAVSPRVLVTNPRRAQVPELVGEVYEADFMPVAAQWGGARLARVLLPAPELQLGWRAHVRAAGAGPATWNPELAWRAALALAAIAIARGHATVDGAAGLVAAESGLSRDQALLQAATVALRPMPALAFLAGRSAVARAVASRAPLEVLRAGPLPGAAIARL